MPPKRRRRFQGLYYHSSPPKVLPMNGQTANSSGRRTRGPEVKLSTIRIWMHEKDIGKLTRVLWAGQGNRLRQQASTNSKVKRFLAAVPYAMNSIKDVHQAVIDNSLENLQANLEPPVPPALVTCRDANGLNLIHKAAGLGHATILEYLITTWPDGVHEPDITGKTPLHWAASAKNNMRCYTLLTQAGCDEEAVDYKMKTPSFYRHKPNEIERAFLTYVPEAPRVSPDVATDWEALSDASADGKKPDIKIPEMNGFGRHSNAESNENTSEAEMTETASGHEDEDAAEDSPETTAEVQRIEENPEIEETAANDNDQEHEAEVELIESPRDEKTDEEESAEAQTDEEDKKPENENENQIQNEDEDMENDKEEPPDEKQQTQTITEATENLTTESTEKDKIDIKSIESKELDQTNDNNTGDLRHEEDNKHVQKGTENENQSSKALEKQGDQDKQQLVQDMGEEKSIESENNSGDNEENEKENIKKETLKENAMNGDKDEDLKKEKASANEKRNKAENQMEQSIKDVKPETDDDQENRDKENMIESSTQEEENNIKTKAEEDDSKTLGETLIAVKDEVKDNIKYLANQVKNVFSEKDEKGQSEDNVDKGSDLDKEDKKEVNGKEEGKEDDKKESGRENTTDKDHDQKIIEEDPKESLEEGEVRNSEEINVNEKEGQENQNANQAQTDQLENPNANQAKNNQLENQNANEAKTDPHESQSADEAKDDVKPVIDTNKKQIEDLLPTSSSSSPGQTEATKLQTEISSNGPTTSHQLDNSSNENFPFSSKTPHPAAPKTPTNSSPTKENEKTEEDENNNNSKLSHESSTNATNSGKSNLTDEQFQEINDYLKEFEKAEQENSSNEKDVTQTLQDMGNNLKETVADMADKIEHAFVGQSETESSDVVLHTEISPQQKSAKQSLKESESSDDTNDEDEEQEIEAEENNETEEADIIINETEPELEPKPDHELEAKPDTAKKTEEMTMDENLVSKEHKPSEEERDGAGSTTSSLAIEGFVQGDAEDNTVQSQTAAFVDDDEGTRLQHILAAGNMDQLAQIVLNGEGKKLLNVQAKEPEIQAFLKNVPNYMSKIRRVHEAARDGSLFNLQQALDRRKFAIAKDEISPNGATPLHVAVLFGNSDIVRYLAARFPETTTITDNDERTALHYAAVINDNGHFYNVLLQLKANPKVIDSMGYTPEDYLNKEELSDVLSYSDLLKRFGAEDLEDRLLSDQGRLEGQSIQENPLFKTEQGKYLADNLADPLIKALTQVAQKRPNDPLQYLASYLQSYATSRNTNGRTITQASIHSGSTQTNSTALASPKQQTFAAHMNGHANSIENDNLPQIESLEEDDGNDSDAAMSKKMEERDEHGQSMLHFACARSHRKGGLIHLIEDAKADITYRDELYRTARDVAWQANQLGNAKEIDRYVISLAIVGDTRPFEYFTISGYDHILDIVDDNGKSIVEVVTDRGLDEMAEYLSKIRPLEELREKLAENIRENNVESVKAISEGPDGKWLIKAKNYFGRTALHIAILKESIEIVEHFVKVCPEALKIGDNLERTPLHYAMGTNIVDRISRVLIQNGAKRTIKDLKGRQPSYYFMNKADIMRLQEEEDENR